MKAITGYHIATDRQKGFYKVYCNLGIYDLYPTFMKDLIHCAVFEYLMHISSVFHASCSLNIISSIQRAWYHQQLTAFNPPMYVGLSFGGL